MHSAAGFMTRLRLISLGESPLRDSEESHPRRPRRPLREALLWLTSVGALACTCVAFWWWSTTTTREIRALPDAQRIPLYRRTMENLKTICDPAASRALRDFCHKEADLVQRFRECDLEPECQELARRHLPQPRR